MQKVVRSFLSEMHASFDEVDGHFLLPMGDEYGPYLIAIQAFEDEPILSLRASLPVTASGEHKAAVLEAALGFNYQQPMVRLGCDPRDGELVIDLEVPVLGHALTKGEFASHLAVVIAAKRVILPQLLKVALGCEDVVQAVGLAAPPTVPMSRAERDAREIVERLGFDEA